MFSYFINIIKMYRGIPKSPRNVKLYIHSLYEKNHIVYYLYLAKIQNENWLSRMELTNYFLTELNDYNINSLNALIKMYKEEKVRLFNIPIKIENANELLIELDKLIMVYEKLIETLENITIDDTNRFNISKILRKMLKDKLITKAFFFNDVSEDIFFKVWDKVFKGFRNETK